MVNSLAVAALSFCASASAFVGTPLARAPAAAQNGVSLIGAWATCMECWVFSTALYTHVMPPSAECM